MASPAGAVWSWHCRGMQPLQVLREFGTLLLSFSSTKFAPGKGNPFLGRDSSLEFRKWLHICFKGSENENAPIAK